MDNPHTEMSLEDARKALPRAQLGDVLRIEIKPKNFGRIAAQTARQVIIQGMREAERGMVFDELFRQGARDPHRLRHPGGRAHRLGVHPPDLRR